ncbi:MULTISPECIES: carbohydrate ABC transporter permease [Vibrio]|uniref:Carbohydrate ABC transporter permease n=1 Tax=Vibrio casei TaxID=673372 RepID=A0A368LIV8_9VIBR|nr:MULTISPECIES: carbohydrate ABC transporter permease [Vibrio]RCS70555.1 carbohydrate ABC transporter permease [Vibrio casei]SJN27604.1 putative sugar ABC transporter, permease protein [Vibrio casei]HBV77845.1 carbohydrate ABC transporter permease [Vibrio sp.]
MSNNKINVILMHAFLVLMSFLSLFPFYWMLVSSTNSTNQINMGKFTFGDQLWVNLHNLTSQVDLLQVFWNTSKIAIISTVSTLAVCSIAGYAFEIYKSKNRDRVYVALLATMMIPFAALMIPLFTMFGKAGLLDTHLAVIMPTVAGAFIIFYFRQCTKTFPKELIDAARVEGVAEWKIFVYIYVPVMKASYAAAFVIVFMASWNSFLWPLIVLQSNDLKTINLVLSSFASAYSPDFGLIMVGTVISTLPSLIIFFAMQKQFVASMTGAVK